MKKKMTVSRRCVLLLTATVFGLVGICSSPSLAQDAANIGSRRELFVDQYLIERMEGARLQLHHPAPQEISLVMDEPWEGSGGYITVFQDDDVYRMYYVGAMMRDVPEEEENQFGIADRFICYAESSDGIHWEKPDLGLIDFKGSRENNIVWKGQGGHAFAPFKDPNPKCDPEARYKAIGTSKTDVKPLPGGTKYLFAFKSPDGLHWSLLEGPKEHGAIFDQQDGDFDSQNLAFWDTYRGEYRLYFRKRRTIQSQDELEWYRGHEGGGGKGYHSRNQVRDIKTATSDDFVQWSDSRFLQYPYAPVEELYTNQITPYYRAPHVFLGFPCRYVQERGAITPWHEEKARETPGRSYTSYTDSLLMSSRDGRTFHRWTQAFIPPGMPEEERWGYGPNSQNWGIVETESDLGAPQLSCYVSEGNVRKRFRRYSLRVDGFVSVTAGLAGGQCVTRPLVFQGHELVINFSTSAAGSLRVEIQGEDGKSISGFDLDDCPQIFGNEIDHVVEWKSGSDLSSLAGKPVRLRFEFRDAHLYSFRLRD